MPMQPDEDLDSLGMPTVFRCTVYGGINTLPMLCSMVPPQLVTNPIACGIVNLVMVVRDFAGFLSQCVG